MKYIIAGGRDFYKIPLMEKIMSQFSDVTTVISGCAKGADTIGMNWAANHGLKVEMFPAKWEQYGTSAGFIRNAEMAEAGDVLVAFWNGRSTGTAHMIQTMKRLGKPIYVYDYEGEPYCV